MLNIVWPICGFHQHCCVTSILIVISPETMLPKQNFNLTTWYDPEEVCINVEYHMDSWLAGHENHKFQLRGYHGQWGLNHPTGFGQGQRSKMISTYIFLLVRFTSGCWMGCWGMLGWWHYTLLLVMTGIIPENSLRLAPVSFGVPIWVPVSLRTHNQ